MKKMQEDLFEYNSTKFTYYGKEIITDSRQYHISGTNYTFDNMSYNYASGFTTSSKKKRKTSQQSVALPPEVNGCHSFDDEYEETQIFSVPDSPFAEGTGKETDDDINEDDEVLSLPILSSDNYKDDSSEKDNKSDKNKKVEKSTLTVTLKSPQVQTTLTQYVSSLNTPLKSINNQTTITKFVTPFKTSAEKKKSIVSTNKFKSRIPGYGKKWRDAMPGDLVMAFASDISHPAVDAGVIHRNYVLVGIVQRFIDVEWNTGRFEDDWNGITTQERLKVTWGQIDGWDMYSCPKPKHPHNSDLKVISLKGDGNLDKINPEIQALIDTNFEFINGSWRNKKYF